MNELIELADQIAAGVTDLYRENAELRAAVEKAEARVKELEWERTVYRACLTEIRRGRGAYAPDPFEHARNVIDSNKDIARRALEEDHGPNDAGEPCVCSLCIEILG